MNKTDKRRQEIMDILENNTTPIKGSFLASQFGVSRQVIVQDIAILKSQNKNIVSTNRGYIIFKEKVYTKIIKVKHTNDQIEEELNSIVDLGATVEDVFIRHKAYGKIKASLLVSSRRDVKILLANIKKGISRPLLNLTDGYHYHTIIADSEDILMEVEDKLRDIGFLVDIKTSVPTEKL